MDSDASSELVLAKHLAETNSLLSKDWFYSTELRVLNTQLIYVPLFKIFDSFRKVRFAGAVILTGIMWLSYGYLACQLKLKRNTFLVSSAILILPTSIAYARIALYHSYYAPHISISFLIVGLFLSICQKKNRNAIVTGIKISVLCLLCFVGCLGGIRQLQITLLPLALTVFIVLVQTTYEHFQKLGIAGYVRKFKSFTKPSQRTALYLLLPVLFSGLLGYIVNSRILAEIYSFRDYNNLELKSPNATIFYKLLEALLTLFGYNQGSNVISAYGVLSLLSVLSLAVVFFLIIRQLRKKTSTGIFTTFFASSFFISSVLFFFTQNFNDLYYIPVLVYLIPVLSVQFDAKDKTPHDRYSMQNIVICGVAVLCFLNSVGTTYYITQKPEQVNIKYTGLVYRNLHTVQELEGTVKFLKSEGYEFGYATFWNSNVLTEISNGKINMSTMNYAVTGYYDWLTLKHYQDETFYSGKTFVLFTNEEIKDLEVNSHSFFQLDKPYT